MTVRIIVEMPANKRFLSSCGGTGFRHWLAHKLGTNQLSVCVMNFGKLNVKSFEEEIDMTEKVKFIIHYFNPNKGYTMYLSCHNCKLSEAIKKFEAKGLECSLIRKIEKVTTTDVTGYWKSAMGDDDTNA